MSDFKRVKHGQKKIKARAFNTMLDAARYYQTNARTFANDPATNAALLAGSLILVANTTDTSFQRHEVAALRAPLILPEDNLLEFQSHVIMTVEVPTLSDFGKFCVLLDDLPAQYEDESSEVVKPVARAIAGGVTQVRLEMNDPDHKFADVTNAERFLTSTVEGSARILWHGDGASGEGWGIVLITGVDAEECPEES